MCLEQAHIYFRVLFFLRLECQKTCEMRGNSTLVFQAAGQIETRFPAGSRDVNRKCRDQNMSIRFSPHFMLYSLHNLLLAGEPRLDQRDLFWAARGGSGTQGPGRSPPRGLSPKVGEVGGRGEPAAGRQGTARESRAPAGMC